jgi:hypothetical protein
MSPSRLVPVVRVGNSMSLSYPLLPIPSRRVSPGNRSAAVALMTMTMTRMESTATTCTTRTSTMMRRGASTVSTSAIQSQRPSLRMLHHYTHKQLRSPLSTLSSLPTSLMHSATTLTSGSSITLRKNNNKSNISYSSRSFSSLPPHEIVGLPSLSPVRTYNLYRVFIQHRNVYVMYSF